jgi:CMP-N-acetylneuraminic acid synthetase
MLHNKTFLAVIPARGGSKRLPKKNILPLGGKPLIAWSIEAAKESKYIDKIVLSSDDADILSIAKEYKIQAIQRDAHLASDTATSLDVVKDVLTKVAAYDYIILLQPTSPLRTSRDIDAALQLLMEKNADAVISVCESEHSPLWSNALPKDSSMHNFLDRNLLNKRSQDLESYYRLNGAIYIIKREKLLEQNSFFLDEKIYAYIMDQRASVDIDTQLDFDFARFLMQGN